MTYICSVFASLAIASAVFEQVVCENLWEKCMFCSRETFNLISMRASSIKLPVFSTVCSPINCIVNECPKPGLMRPLASSCFIIANLPYYRPQFHSNLKLTNGSGKLFHNI
jgi:hypothetical protein